MPELCAPLSMAIRKAEHLGVTLPKPVTTTWAHLTEMVTPAPVAAEELRSAIEASLARGKDPRDDPKIVKAAAAQHLAGPAMHTAITHRASTLFADQAEAIFASFTGIFDRAAKALTEIHADTGAVDLKTDEAAKNTAALNRARTGVEVIQTIENIWKTFAIHGSTFTYDKRYRLLVIADVPPETWQRMRPDLERRITAWDAVCAGFPLSLANPSTYRDRVEAIQACAQRAQEELEHERQAERHAIAVEPRRRLDALDAL